MEDAPKRRLRRTVIIVVAVVLVLAGAFVVWETVRTRSLAEVLAMDRWQAGTQVTVEGTIAEIQRYETSYGPVVALGLDGTAVCGGQGSNPAGGVLGDPNATYAIGERFRTTLHFRDYRFNGAMAVWAPELVCPLPVLFAAVGYVMDRISTLGGILLAYNGTDSAGWTRYDIMTPFADSFRPDVLPVTLRQAVAFTTGTIDSAGRWTTVASLEYVSVSGQFSANPVVDDMTSLAAGTSRNGTIRYVDIDGDGLVSDGDRLDVRLPSPGAGDAYTSYMLQIGEVGGRTAAYAYGGHYILNGPRGPYEPLPAAQDPLVELRYAGDRAGNPVTSELAVAATHFGLPQTPSGLQFTLAVNGTYATGDFDRLPATVLGVTLTFADANANGILDPGDRILFANLANQTSVRFQLVRSGKSLAEQAWTTGYGRWIGRLPSFALAPSGTDPTHVAVTVDFWHPDLALNGTLRASLRQDGLLVLGNVSLSSGTPFAFAGGNLTFYDRDGDGHLSTGDEFLVQGTAGAIFEFTVSFFGMPFRMTTFSG